MNRILDGLLIENMACTKINYKILPTNNTNGI